MKDKANNAPKPRRLTSRVDRRMARRTRDFQWKFTEKCAEHDPLWFCVWNKERRDEGLDEFRCCLMTGRDIVGWISAHKDWFKVGRWSVKRYARPVRLTDVGRQALAEREKYDLDDVYGGLVDPGYVVRPARSRRTKKTATQ